jgi:ATP synthase F1 complex assembly factor 2
MITPRKIQSFVLPKARLLNIRCFHNSLLTSGKNTFRDTRVAGRQRFYKLVGVTQVSAPWEKSSAQEESIDSPVSAGIDGSASASGVRHLSKHIDISELEYMLTPRKPGSTSPTTNPSWHSVTLDGRIMKTPMGQVLAVPSQSLAHAIAAEWDAQEKYIQPANMPLMTLACTALDQVAHHPQTYREQSMNYLPTDTVSICLS